VNAIEPLTDYLPRLVDAYLDELLTQLPGVLVVGPRATGKTTTISRRARTVIRLAAGAEAAAFAADPDTALRGLEEPVLLDEWQEVPEVFGAAARAINADPRPSRYFLTGSVRAHLQNRVYAGTGRIVQISMYPMTVREKRGNAQAPTFFDKVAAGSELTVSRDTPDLRGYVDLALESGFPVAALLLSGAARDAALAGYIDDLLTRDVEQVEDLHGQQRGYDRIRLRRYFEAYAVNSSGVVDDKTLYDAAGVNRETALAYEQLLVDLFVAESVPAWSSNRLSRVTHRAKRYVIDPALIAAALRIDANGIVHDGDLLGRVLDTFVAAQLRPEVTVSNTKPRLYHLRTKGGRQEVDLLAELGGERVMGIEIKATAAPASDDAKHLAWLREQLGDRFIIGVVFHTGPRLYELSDRIIAAPISTLWG
jgi:predicted AAA+ superfamily ATPase